MYKIGLSSCGKEINEDLFRQYREAGIYAMEISPAQDKYGELQYDEILRLSKENGIKLWSFHLPFVPFKEIDISNPSLCAKTVEYISELIKKAGDIGIGKFVIHSSGEPITDDERGTRMECAKESLFKLAEVAKSCGGVVAVENLPRTCLGRNSKEILELISAHKDLRVCFDTNHLLCEDTVEFIKAIGDKIITTHVSDYDFINERHWLPGEGKLDWQAVLCALKEIGYNGIWLYEIGFVCPKTIIRNRDLNCADFVNNAKEIFDGKIPARFSQLIENLGMWG